MPLPTGGDSTVLRVGLGALLRSLRVKAGLTRDAAGCALGASAAKINRLELGRVRFKERDVDDLITLYGIVDPDERRLFLEFVRWASSPH